VGASLLFPHSDYQIESLAGRIADSTWKSFAGQEYMFESTTRSGANFAEFTELTAYGPIWEKRSYGGHTCPLFGHTDRDARPSFGTFPRASGTDRNQVRLDELEL
jgi:hypothetical protein